MFSTGTSISIGELNIKISKKMLAKQGITIDHEDVGGNRGRNILFDPNTGKIVMHYQEKNSCQKN